MAKESVERLIDRKNKAWQETDMNQSIFEDAYEYLMPFRNVFSNQGKAHNKNTKQYDSTGMIAAVNFVNTMQSRFTPVFQKWAELKAGPSIPENLKSEQNKRLGIINDKLNTYRNASNFYTSTAEMYFDLGIGTGVLFILEGDEERPINYVCAPLAHCGFEDGKFGEIGGLWRKHKLKGRLVGTQWKGAVIPPALAQRIKDKPDETLEFSEGFYFDYADLVWHQCVIWEEGKETLYEDMFTEAPFVAPRWMKIPGFATGIGPFLMAMADYKTLNKMKELMLMLAALNVFGVYTVASGGTFNPNTAQIKPAAFIPVERNGTQNPSIAALPRTGDFQVQEFMMTDLKEQIKKVMLDSGIPPEQDPVRTAYEIAERIKKMQLDIGAAFGRLIYEFALPLHKREIAILAKKGLIEVSPDFRIDNFFVQVSVVSPIAQAQAAEDVQKLVQAYQLTAGISPEIAMLTFDIEKVGTWIADKLSVDPTLVNGEENKAQIKDAVTKLVAQLQMAAANANAQTGQQPGQAVA